MEDYRKKSDFMRKENKCQNKICFNIVFTIALFFSFLCLFPVKVFAWSKPYRDFDWDEFYKEQRKYWNGNCSNGEDEGCDSKFLLAQKDFYIKLYESLAKYEEYEYEDKDGNKKNLYINDNIILETVYFELQPDENTNHSEDTKYQSYYDSAKMGINASGKEDDINPDDPFTEAEYREYFEKETDTLKILIKNCISYTATCYGNFGDPTKVCTKDNETGEDTDNCKLECDNGMEPTETEEFGTKCVEKVAKNRLGFWEKFQSMFENIPFLGLFFRTDGKILCDNYQTAYPRGTLYDHANDPEVNYSKYFDFLKENRYFDRKAHLQHYFYEKILLKEKVDCLTNDVCENSLEATGKYDEYEETLIEIRTKIVDQILSILESYGIKIDAEGYIYDPTTSEGGPDTGSGILGSSEECNDNMLWPIGSQEVTNTEGGKMFYTGTPMITHISSGFGRRNLTYNGSTSEETHNGIDIEDGNHADGVVPIIAVADGRVTKVKTNCDVGDDKGACACGNYVIISHSDSLETKYCHMARNTIVVSQDEQVYRGQVLGKMGNTGKSTGTHLHFAVLVSGDYVDPVGADKKYVDPDNPRPVCEDGAGFSLKETSLNSDQFVQKVREYCESNNCPQQIVDEADTLYQKSVNQSMNPEFVFIYAIMEGFSPAGNETGSYNYWGLNCNFIGELCTYYGNMESALNGVKSKVGSASNIINFFSDIGDYWYSKNQANASLFDGCYYLDNIKQYLNDSTHAETACGDDNKCLYPGPDNCTKLNDDEKRAFRSMKVKTATDLRQQVFGVSD